ncbi:MAG: glutamate--tRNA ligase [Mariprofundales bacterium]
MTITTRFAPSPTGLIHLGNVRTALLNWLLARKMGGKFVLRFEDTDGARNQQPFIDAIMGDLHWLGLDWDGEPRFQSAHATAHRQALQQLARDGKAYRCFCSEHQLQVDKKLAAARGLPPRYAGRCRTLDAATAEVRASKEPFVWRLAVHDSDPEAVITVPDQLRGDIQFLCKDLDDPVVVRSDGSFTFMLPNAIDDAVDGISHVLRGDDHLTNTAWQVWLLQQLGHAVPRYLHHGLLLNSEGKKLSKRDGAPSVADLRAAGLQPQAVIQTMVRLGHPNIDDTVMEIDALCQQFKPASLSSSAVRWSDTVMWHWHERLLRALPAPALAKLIAPYFPACDEARLIAVAALINPNLSRVEDAAAFSRLIDAEHPFAADDLALLQQAGSDFFTQAIALWGACASDGWKVWTNQLKTASGNKGKMLFMPLRLALTGNTHGPDMASVIGFLGDGGVTARLNHALEMTQP